MIDGACLWRLGQKNRRRAEGDESALFSQERAHPALAPEIVIIRPLFPIDWPVGTWPDAWRVGNNAVDLWLSGRAQTSVESNLSAGAARMPCGEA